ncbi:MAG TPA: hypothetical protein VJU59_31330 [Paraburkholderia sp.]|uniref:hypothetical protein n=1 Tax=Paraburkholderia sp. TaxID=1926495 RepID=UPI002B483D7A|nr:hypothetical protein [Paraburkholderia sp.]HKR44117.1 hypothetical protein [Paraburkholderia sp.]
MDLNIEAAELDDFCKAVLRKLKDNGFDKAGVSYVTKPEVISQPEFVYLAKNSSLANGGQYMRILAAIAVPELGPNSGSITFRLSVDLT